MPGSIEGFDESKSQQYQGQDVHVAYGKKSYGFSSLDVVVLTGKEGDETQATMQRIWKETHQAGPLYPLETIQTSSGQQTTVYLSHAPSKHDMEVLKRWELQQKEGELVAARAVFDSPDRSEEEEYFAAKALLTSSNGKIVDLEKVTISQGTKEGKKTIEITEKEGKHLAIGGTGVLTKVSSTIYFFETEAPSERRSEERVMKKSLKGQEKALLEEFQALKIVNPEGTAPVQPPPFYAIKKKGTGEVTLLMKLYNQGDLSHYVQMDEITPQKTLRAFSGVYDGIVHNKERGMAHGDINLVNIFVNEDKENLEVHVSDYGSVKFFDKIPKGQREQELFFAKINPLDFATFSMKEETTALSDKKALSSALRGFIEAHQKFKSLIDAGKNPRAVLPDLCQKYRELVTVTEQLQVFQAGVTLLQALTLKENTTRAELLPRKDGYVDAAAITEEGLKKKLRLWKGDEATRTKIAQFLFTSLKADPSERPTPEQASRMFKALIA